jgi:hypothetical protein
VEEDVRGAIVINDETWNPCVHEYTVRSYQARGSGITVELPTAKPLDRSARHRFDQPDSGLKHRNSTGSGGSTPVRPLPELKLQMDAFELSDADLAACDLAESLCRQRTPTSTPNVRQSLSCPPCIATVVLITEPQSSARVVVAKAVTASAVAPKQPSSSAQALVVRYASRELRPCRWVSTCPFAFIQ